MAKGKTENLKPVQTKDEARERGRAGGIASGKARRERKAFRDLMQHYLDEPATVNGEKVTRKHAAVVKAINMLNREDISPTEFIRLFELVRDTVGEKPQMQVEVATGDQAKVAEFLEYMESGEKG